MSKREPPKTNGGMEMLKDVFPDCNKSTKDCINAIANTNCDNMDKLANDLVTNAKNLPDSKAVLQTFTDDWNENIASDDNNNLEKIGNFFGTLDTNMKCFRESFNKYSKQQNLNSPSNDFEKGLLKGTQGILKKNVCILLAVLLILMLLIDNFVQDKNIRLFLISFLLIISIVVVYIIK